MTAHIARNYQAYKGIRYLKGVVDGKFKGSIHNEINIS